MRASAKIEEFVSVMYQGALIITVTLVACDMFLSGAYQSNNMYSKTCHVPLLISQFEHNVFPFLTWIKRHRHLVSIPHHFSVAVPLPTYVMMHASAVSLVGASGCKKQALLVCKVQL